MMKKRAKSAPKMEVVLAAVDDEVERTGILSDDLGGVVLALDESTPFKSLW